MKRREEPEINQALPIRHPMYLDGSAVIIVAVLEFIAVVVDHALHWPWWIGAQAPVAYLWWGWSYERKFAHRLSVAWNRKRDNEVELHGQLREALRRNRES